MADNGKWVPDETGRDPSYNPDERDSPCVAVCSTLYDEICRGCGRTVMEVANWVFLPKKKKGRCGTAFSARDIPDEIIDAVLLWHCRPGARLWLRLEV